MKECSAAERQLYQYLLQHPCALVACDDVGPLHYEGLPATFPCSMISGWASNLNARQQASPKGQNVASFLFQKLKERWSVHAG